MLFEGDRCTLSIREAYLEDAGVYRCEARNPYGTDTTVSKLHVERKLWVINQNEILYWFVLDDTNKFTG